MYVKCNFYLATKLYNMFEISKLKMYYLSINYICMKAVFLITRQFSPSRVVTGERLLSPNQARCIYLHPILYDSLIIEIVGDCFLAILNLRPDNYSRSNQSSLLISISSILLPMTIFKRLKMPKTS